MRISIVSAAWVILVAAVLLRSSWLESSLLRMDPQSIRMPSAPADFAAARGRQLFDDHCAACHGQNGFGDSARGIPNLTDADWLYGAGSLEDIEQVVRFGIRSHHAKSWDLAAMPAYATARPSSRDARIPPLTPGNIRDVVEFIIQAQGLPAEAAAATRGARLFLGPAGCYDCHATDAKGDSAIGAPNLTDRVTLYGDGSRDSLALSIALGRHGMCPAWEGRLPPAAVREVSVFVHSLSHGPSTHEPEDAHGSETPHEPESPRGSDAP